MRGRYSTGTVISAVGHAGLIVWVLLGDWLFSSRAVQMPQTTTVEMISSSQFDAMQAATANPVEVDTGEEGAPEPEAAPSQSVPETLTAPPSRPEPVAQPEAAPPPPEPVVTEQTPPSPSPSAVVSDLTQAVEEQPLASLSTSRRPKPRPADLVAPNPVVTPPEQNTSDAPTPAVSETAEPTPEPPQEAREETAQQDSGDILRSEATEEQDEAMGMQTSQRPRVRPNRPVETPAEETPKPAVEKPAEKPTVEKKPESKPASSGGSDTNSTQDAVAAALAEAARDADSASSSSSSNSSSANSGGGRNAPQGVPLNAGEIGDISSAISRKWNVGTMSTEAMSTIIVVSVTFDQSGKPDAKMTLVESSGPSQQAIDVAFRNARSAIARAYQDGGIPLPADKYETWKVLEFVFDANGMRMR